MASLEKQKGVYRVVFRFGGRRLYRSLRTRDRQEAESYLDTVERRLAAHHRGELTIPDDADIATFLLSGQARDHDTDSQRLVNEPQTTGHLFSQYFASVPPDALEQNTLYT